MLSPCHHLSGCTSVWTLQWPWKRQNWGSPYRRPGAFRKWKVMFGEIIIFKCNSYLFSSLLFPSFFLFLLSIFFYFFLLHTVIKQHINVLDYFHLECWKTNSTKDHFGHLPYWFNMVILLGFFAYLISKL